MKNACRVKGIDFTTFYNSLFSSEWLIKDLPFEMRANELENVNLDLLPVKFEDEAKRVLFLDKVHLLNSILGNMKPENLRHLNIILNPTIKNVYSNSSEDLIADTIIIRHNRIFLIQFAYDMLSNVTLQEIEKDKVKYTLKDLENIMKKYLPEDTVVSHFLFTIKTNNSGEILRLSKKIETFFKKTTNRELLKLFE